MRPEKFRYAVKKTVYDLFWNLKSTFWLFVPAKKGIALSNTLFSIGIVTYVDRYDRFFKPLIKELVTLFPDTEFVIGINGYHDQIVQLTYLREIGDYLSQFVNVKVIDYHQAQSLSKLWNQLIIHSSFSKTIILNDDIRISPAFRRDLERSGVLNEKIALINRSWSHFIIAKETIREIGWFDQRFPGVGNEDEDYECRLVLSGILVGSFKIKELKNIAFKTINFSYGEHTEVVNLKYVKANKVYFDKKWEIRKEPAPGFEYVAIISSYARLKEGMDTPQFYSI